MLHTLFLLIRFGRDAVDYRGLINLKRYPVDRQGEFLDEGLAAVWADLIQGGCAVLSSFLTLNGVSALKEETDQTASHARRTLNLTNSYFTEDDPSLPKDHPKRRFYDRSNALVPANNFNS